MPNNSHTIRGKVLQVSQAVQKGKNENFRVRFFLLETEENDPQYAQRIKFQCAGNNVDVVDESWADRDVEVSFNIRGYEYDKKNYVNLNVYKCERLASEDAATVHAQNDQSGGGQGSAIEDDVPF
jgi:non-homologous end joining protein Ku